MVLFLWATPWSYPWSLSFWLSHQYPICIPCLPHSCYKPCPPHPPWLDHSNYIWRRVQVMKLLIVQFIVIIIIIIIMLMHIVLFPNVLLTILLPWRIRHCDLFPIRIILELWILQTACRILWTGDQPRVWFQPTTTMFKRGKIFYVLERATTEIGHHVFLKWRIQEKYEDQSIYMHYTWMMTDTYKTWLEIGMKEVI
jgi:hypothetical protein